MARPMANLFSVLQNVKIAPETAIFKRSEATKIYRKIHVIYCS